MTLMWVPGHHAGESNKRADDLISRGDTNPLPGLELRLGITLSSANRSTAN